MTPAGWVLDASALLALLLGEEESAEMDQLLRGALSAQTPVCVPALAWYEVGNGLCMACRRGRISHDELIQAEADLAALTLETDSDLGPAVRQHIRELAVQHNLTMYDAAYLELSLRRGYALKSFDEHLQKLRPAAGPR